MAERSNLSVLEQNSNVTSFFQESDFSHCVPKSHLYIESSFRIYVHHFFLITFFLYSYVHLKQTMVITGDHVFNR